MAVMTTTLSNDGVILEQKTQPVPSSEKMALDLDINGTTKRDETNLDFEIPKPSVIPNFDSSPNLVDAAELARKQNNEAIANNDSIMEDAVVSEVKVMSEKEINNETSDAVNSTVNKNQIEGNKSVETADEEIKTTSASGEIAEQNISKADSTSFETSATTTVPPLVESQESHLRQTTIPVSQTEAAEIKAEKHAMDLNADPELANGLDKAPGGESMEGITNGNGEAANGVEAQSQSSIPEVGESQAAELAEGEKVIASDNSIEPANAMNAASPAAEGDSHNIENLSIAPNAQEQHPQIPDIASNAQPEQPIESPSAQAEQAEIAAPSEPPADVNMTEAEIPKQDADMEVDDLFGESAAPAHGESAAPQSSGNKVAREREEDTDMDAPEAKRMRVDSNMNVDVDHQIDYANDVSLVDFGNNVNTQVGDAVEDDDTGGPGRPITPDLQRLLKNSVQSARKGKVGQFFRQPVVKLWDTLADSYLEKVPNPIDLSVIEKNLAQGVYNTLGDYKADVELIVSNCVLYNGPDHDITRSSIALKEYLYNKIPSVNFVPPAPKQKARRSTPSGDAAARRPSRTVNAVSPPVPKVKAAEPYPLDPVTQTPVIRRDSTLGDNGRPKRDIHPPKPKDIFTQPNKTNRKKNALELRFCENLLQDVMKPRNLAMNQFFMEPVDPVALGIPQYFKIIKKPIDLSTIQQKLNNGHYFSAKEFEADFRLMLDNCFKFNPSDNLVHQKGRDLERYFTTEWEKKARFMSTNAPQRERAMSPDSDEDQSEEEEEDVPTQAGETERLELLTKIREEQGKLLKMNKEGAAKSTITLQEQIVAMTENALDSLEKDLEGAKKKIKKAKAPAKVNKKAAAPAKRSKKPKLKYMGHAEKEIISQGIGQLDDKNMQMVIAWIRNDVDGLDQVDDDNMELDIDAVSDVCLNRLYDLVISKVPGIAETIAPEPAQPRSAPASKPKKKNKPMGKSEQEQKIAQLRQVVGAAQASQAGMGSTGLSSAPTASAASRYGDSGGPGKIMPSVEQDEVETSGDEEESDSEEED